MMKPRPEWVNTLAGKYEAGIAHTFLLHFNVEDYPSGTMTLREYLEAFLANRDLIVYYDRAAGFSFPATNGSMREKFMEAVGLGTSPAGSRSALPGIPGGGPVPLPTDPGACFALLEKLFQQGKFKATLVIEYSKTLFPEGAMTSLSPADRAALVWLQKWAKSSVLMGHEHMILLTERNLLDIHSDLRQASSGIESILLPLPGYEERRAFIEGLLAREDVEGVRLEMSLTALAMMTAGLSKRHIEDIALRALAAGTPITREHVRERKDEIIRMEFGDVIEIVEPNLDYSLIGGHRHVKEYLRRSVIGPFTNGQRARAPLGVLLTGPSGTGKSALALATAAESGANMVILNLARIFAGVVGSSERNLEKALLCIETLAPVIVFIDELDQALTRNQGQQDSGVSARLFKRLLEFMSDPQSGSERSHRGRICFIAATNRPDLLDAALKRPGRFDKKIPCLPPDREEREEVFACMLRKHRLSAPDWNLAAAADKTEGYTGAEIEAVTLKAYEIALDRGALDTEGGTLGQEDLDLALEAICASTAEIEYMTAVALSEVSDRTLLPERYRNLNRQELARKVEAHKSEEEVRDGRRKSRSL